MILLVKEPINHEYAHLYFLSIRRLLPKQKTPAKFNTISATINTIYQRYTSQYGAPTYSFVRIVIVCILSPPVPFWSCLHQKNTTSFSDLQRLFDLNMKTHTFKFIRRYRMYTSSITSLLVLSTPEKHLFRVFIISKRGRFQVFVLCLPTTL